MNYICRCEAKQPTNTFCNKCMGSKCTNQTYEFNGTIYHLVDAILLWKFPAYDGPIDGIAVYKGFACYAKTYTHYRNRSYWLYPLQYSEWTQEIKVQAHRLTAPTRFGPNIRIPETKEYTKRDPLGFFRIINSVSPLESNRIIERPIEDRYHSNSYYETTASVITRKDDLTSKYQTTNYSPEDRFYRN